MRNKPSAVSNQQSAISHQRSNAGFTLIELLVAMVVFVLVIAAASQIFTGLLTQFKQQSKITETDIEGAVGLDILRRDIEHAGYGLPWVYPAALPGTYSEAPSAPASAFNDTSTTPPRAILSGNNMTTFVSPNNVFNGSDYLVIKAVNVAQNSTVNKWTVLNAAPFTTGYNPRRWDDASGTAIGSENLTDRENVIVLSMGATSATARTLIMSGSSISTLFSGVASSTWAPSDAKITHAVYGITPAGTAPQRPFNRADYFISRATTDPATDTTVPDRCAPNTGVLRKAVLNNGAVTEGITPLLDCAADMQVIYRLDMDENGTAGTNANADGSTVSSSEGATAATVQATFGDASLLRRRLKEVRVYVLAHEGQRDVNYTYPPTLTPVTVGEFGLGRPFDLTTIPNYQNYRWKVFILVVKTSNLGG